MSKDIDQPLADDVALFLINESEFYHQCKDLRDNYTLKHLRGIFNPELAIKGLECHVSRYIKSPAFKQYYADITANPATRQEIARQILEHWDEEIRIEPTSL